MEKGKYHNDLISYANFAKENNVPHPKRFCFVLTNLCNFASSSFVPVVDFFSKTNIYQVRKN